MNLFLDTSSLFKLYHIEHGSDRIRNVFSQNEVSTIFLSDLSKIEFISAIWKKVRTRELGDDQARRLTELFEKDFDKYDLCR